MSAATGKHLFVKIGLYFDDVMHIKFMLLMLFINRRWIRFFSLPINKFSVCSFTHQHAVAYNFNVLRKFCIFLILK